MEGSLLNSDSHSSIGDEIDNVNKQLNEIAGIKVVQPILFIDINITDDSNERICVYEGDKNIKSIIKNLYFFIFKLFYC